MTLTVEVNGQPYTDAIAINVNRSIKNMLGDFSIQTSANEDELLPLRVDDVVKIYADGNVVLNGFVDRVEPSNSASSHIITVYGRDRTQDLLDSTIRGDKTFAGGLLFTDIARRVLDAGKMTNIGIVNETGINPRFNASDVISAEVTDGAFWFLEKLARKLQFVLTTNEDGDLLMLRASVTKLPMRLVNVVGGDKNNVLESSMTKDNSGRYNTYSVISQLSPVNSTQSAANITNQIGTAIDNTIRESRFIQFNSEEELDNDRIRSRASFEANIRRASSLDYKCTIQGNSIDGELIKMNRIVHITDSKCDIASDMLLHTVGYSYSSNGSSTSLEFSYPDAYSLGIEQSAREIARSETAGGF